VAQTAQANFPTRGVRVVPYPSDMRAFAPQAQLAAIEHRWGGFYTRVAESVLAGTWKPEPTWGGIASGMVDLAAVDPALPEAARSGVQGKRAAIVAGSLKPFAAPLRDNAGVVRLASGSLDDAQIKTMDWFVEGVVGTVPKAR
jgi:simple sugar transport system substrate-binding protein